MTHNLYLMDVTYISKYAGFIRVRKGLDKRIYLTSHMIVKYLGHRQLLIIFLETLSHS